ncbi:SH3 domain-containing protein [Lysobacter silvisoli]|uniref:SH3 domain-containing protein n=1 Tax=Lysobacter silvisoli TaxID=2293254 RepID=A0A371K4C0_9GAMM|nr:SH3 domain-containing protein [Lysobacter silvisoli]RDZ28781.1 SH3 domain-containing protein [Lysobacter silvisoli]
MSFSPTTFIAALFLALAAHAGDARAASAACELDVYAKDTDPKGLNVRSGPSINAPVVATLPGWNPPGPDDELEGHLPVGFTIVEARDGWVRIADVSIPDPATGAHRASPIRGWVSGKRVGYNLQTEVGFQNPDPSSPALIQQDGGIVLTDAIGISGCTGEWARIDYGDPRSPKRAWFRGLCGLIETTCDGRNGDESRGEDADAR